MTDIPKKTARTEAENIVQMTKEAKRIERRLGAKACVVICFFEKETETGTQVTVQDAGMFPMAPDQFYQVMQDAHRRGQLNSLPKSRIIRPN